MNRHSDGDSYGPQTAWHHHVSVIVTNASHILSCGILWNLHLHFKAEALELERLLSRPKSHRPLVTLPELGPEAQVICGPLYSRCQLITTLFLPSDRNLTQAGLQFIISYFWEVWVDWPQAQLDPGAKRMSSGLCLLLHRLGLLTSF